MVAAGGRQSRLIAFLAALLGGLLFIGAARAEPLGRVLPADIHHICDLIELEALRNGLPRAFFARLIWKESRFDPNAVSPVGAQGIAQFMPGTAKLRGLADPYDINQAIPASASYLAELRKNFGNLGLAAAAYNAGENRVSRWLTSGGFLPLETSAYVFDIMGEPADNFAEAAYSGTIHPLDPKLDFGRACRQLPAIMSATIAMASLNIQPWGIQVAGNFRRTAAIGQWERLKKRFPTLLAEQDPVIDRVRTPMGRRGIYAVRIGAEERAAANEICRQLRGVGGSCVVSRNR